MMTDAWGTVTAVDDQHASIHMDEIGCGRCGEPGGCGGKHLGKLLCGTPRTVRVRNPDPVSYTHLTLPTSDLV